MTLAIRQEVDTAIERKIDPVEMATVIYPRMEAALAIANTTDEANEIRAQVETVNTYIKRELPRYIKERRSQFEHTHQGDMLYLEASAKAGQLWEACDKKRPGGNYSNSQNFSSSDYLSVTDVGFKGSADATTCQRIGELLETEDWRVYSEETFEKMRQPTLHGAERIWKMLFQADPLPPVDGKYRVIYADPPWSYGNTMPDYAPDQGTHYNLMTIDELCEMNIEEAAEDDAVLFLWVTSPILEDAFKVVKAWGFTYKASFVWDKIKHNMGHYNSVRHEFLLVCTRGSCQPDVLKLFDSVVSVERTRHSEKPEEFRDIIDAIYPHGNRIELFARKTADGWESYGNEVAVS